MGSQKQTVFVVKDTTIVAVFSNGADAERLRQYIGGFGRVNKCEVDSIDLSKIIGKDPWYTDYGFCKLLLLY